MPLCFCGYCALAIYVGQDLTCWEAQHLPQFALESHAEFKFPPSAQGINTATDSHWTSCTMAVTFKMQPRKLDQFVSSTRLKFLTTAEVPEYFFQEGGAGMAYGLGLDQRAVKSHLMGYKISDDLDQQHIFVDTSDPKSYVVYIITKEGVLD